MLIGRRGRFFRDCYGSSAASLCSLFRGIMRRPVLQEATRPLLCVQYSPVNPWQLDPMLGT